MVDRSALKSEIQKNVKDNFVMVYSKSYCPVRRALVPCSCRTEHRLIGLPVCSGDWVVLQRHQTAVGKLEGQAR
jgi:hypothetical protein